jgi:hypothetical protein
VIVYHVAHTTACGRSCRDAQLQLHLAESFTDRLLVVDLRQGDLPVEVRDLLADHDLRGADAVYGRDDDDDRSSVGEVSDATGHQFVDVRTRGEHRSDVVE